MTASATCVSCGGPLRSQSARDSRCAACWGQAKPAPAPVASTDYGQRLATLTSIGIPAPGGAR